MDRGLSATATSRACAADGRSDSVKRRLDYSKEPAGKADIKYFHE
jgi:hypothetical protein